MHDEGGSKENKRIIFNAKQLLAGMGKGKRDSAGY